MAFDDDCAAVVDVDEGVQWGYVLGCLVGGGEVIEEEAGLEEGVFEDLGGTDD